MGCSSSSKPVVAPHHVLSKVASGSSHYGGSMVSMSVFHDNYLLGAKLGRGSFAQVRAITEVRPENSETKINDKAVKIMDMRCANEPGKPQSRPGMLMEIKAWYAVGNHKACVRLYEHFLESEFCFLVMEKCSSSLLQFLEQMPELNEKSFGNIFAQMLQGICHVHSVRVVHRDIKPDNCLVGGIDGRTVKLCDFGQAAIFPKTGKKLRGAFGACPFMCPEMIRGRSYDGGADVWSMAVVVYVLLFGNFPYEGQEKTSKSMKKAISKGVPPTFQCKDSTTITTRSDMADEFAKALLCRNPAERPSAQGALNTTFMMTISNNIHIPSNMPSLRPVLHSAKKAGAFAIRDTSKETNVDVRLGEWHMSIHGVAMPDSPESLQSEAPRKNSGRSNSSSTESTIWDNYSGCDTGASTNSSRIGLVML